MTAAKNATSHRLHGLGRHQAFHGPAELQLPNNVELPDRMPMSVVDRIIVPMQQMPSLRTKKEGR
jgi:hypothetical protein